MHDAQRDTGRSVVDFHAPILGIRRGREFDVPQKTALNRCYFGVKLNFCPPTEASYMSPPLMSVKIATPRS